MPPGMAIEQTTIWHLVAPTSPSQLVFQKIPPDMSYAPAMTDLKQFAKTAAKYSHDYELTSKLEPLVQGEALPGVAPSAPR